MSNQKGTAEESSKQTPVALKRQVAAFQNLCPLDTINLTTVRSISCLLCAEQIVGLVDQSKLRKTDPAGFSTEMLAHRLNLESELLRSPQVPPRSKENQAACEIHRARTRCCHWHDVGCELR